MTTWSVLYHKGGLLYSSVSENHATCTTARLNHNNVGALNGVSAVYLGYGCEELGRRHCLYCFAVVCSLSSELLPPCYSGWNQPTALYCHWQMLKCSIHIAWRTQNTKRFWPLKKYCSPMREWIKSIANFAFLSCIVMMM